MKKILNTTLLLLLLATGAGKAQAQEPYAYGTYDAETTTITIFYDDNWQAKMDAGITVYGWAAGLIPSWNNPLYSDATRIVVDDSFRSFYPTTMERWFEGLTALKEIVGIEKINTGNVTSFQGLFSNCSSLESIDLSHFNTSSATSMQLMFSKCTRLKSLDLSSFRTIS